MTKSLMKLHGDSIRERAAKDPTLFNRYGLTYREREIIKLRCGLDDGGKYTLEECGRIFEVTRERIRSIEQKALNKLGIGAVE